MRLTAEEDPETIKRYGHIRPARGWRTRSCSTTCPGTVRTCTLERGHRGPHVAHGSFKKVLAVWNSGTGAEVSNAMVTRASEARARSGLRSRMSPGILETLWRFVVRTLSSAEEIALVILFLAFVWFGIGWILLILG